MSDLWYRARVAWRVMRGKPVGYRLVFRDVDLSATKDTLLVQCKFEGMPR